MTLRQPLWIWIGILAVLFVVLRLSLFEADPPSHFPNGKHTVELFVEGPAKSIEARKYALKGTYSTNSADQYNFWRIQSPLYVIPLGWHLSLFGIERIQVALYGIAVSFMGFIALLALLKTEGRPITLFAGGLFAVLHYYAIHYSRNGLIEPQLTALLTICLLCCILGQKKRAFLYAAPIVWMLAFLTKQTAIVFLPVLVTALFIHSSHKSKTSTTRRLLPWAVLGAVGAFLFSYILQEEYMQKITWNTHVAIANKQFGFSDIVVSPLEHLQLFVGNFFSFTHFWEGAWSILPVTLPFALAHILRTAFSILKKRPVSNLRLLSCIWLVSSLGIILISFRTVIRYSLILFPPTFLLAAIEIGLLAQALRRKKRVQLLFVTSVCTFFAYVHIHWQIGWLKNPTYELRGAQHTLAKHLGPSDVVVGKRASLLAFNSKADIFLVRNIFNTDANTLMQLGVTHVISAAARIKPQYIREYFPGALQEENNLDTVFWQGGPLHLYRLDAPLSHYYSK